MSSTQRAVVDMIRRETGHCPSQLNPPKGRGTQLSKTITPLINACIRTNLPTHMRNYLPTQAHVYEFDKYVIKN